MKWHVNSDHLFKPRPKSDSLLNILVVRSYLHQSMKDLINIITVCMESSFEHGGKHVYVIHYMGLFVVLWISGLAPATTVQSTNDVWQCRCCIYISQTSFKFPHRHSLVQDMNHGRIQTLQKPGLSNINYNQLRLQCTTRGQVVFTILCQIVLYIQQQAQTSCLLESGKGVSQSQNASQPKFIVLQNIFQFK